jgi:lipoyl-dependent peroxiredoxin subunit D
MEALLSSIPDYAKDLKLNLSAVLKQAELTEQQIWGTAVAAAIATRNAELTNAVLAEAKLHLSSEALSASKSASAIMGMNNIYYRFHHLSGNDAYASIPARLRMQVVRSHGSDPIDFELWCTAVSAITGCGTCVASHERVLRDKGIKEVVIIAAIRIASVIHAIGPVLDAETAQRSLPAGV